MPTIYREHPDLVTVQEAKRLIAHAFPPEEVISVWAEVDGNGDPLPDGRIEARRNKQAFPRETFLNADFPEHCSALGIQPRMTWRPNVREYTGSKQDAFYSISHDEFTLLAAEFGVQVVIGPAPAPREAESKVQAAAPPTADRFTPEQIREGPQPNATRFRLRKPQRMDGLSVALYRTLCRFAESGSEKPSARAVLEEWSKDGCRPREIVKVMADGAEYYVGTGARSGETNQASLDNLTDRIGRMTAT